MSNGVAGSFVWPLHPLLFSDAEGHSSAPDWSENIDWRFKEVTAKLEVWKEWKPCSVTYYKWTATPYSTFPPGHTLGHFTEQHLLHQKESTPFCGHVFSFLLDEIPTGKEGECQVTYTLYTHSLPWELVSALSVLWGRCSKTMGTRLGLISQRKGDSLSSDDISRYQYPINTITPMTCTLLCSPGQCSISS